MGHDEGAGKLGDNVGVGAEAAVALADHRIGGVEVQIDHGAEIEVEAGLGQLLRHGRIEADGALLIAVARVAADAPRRGEGAVSVSPRQPLHVTAFLIDGDERDRRLWRIAQERREFAELLGPADILGVEHDAPDHAVSELAVDGDHP
jgi:hypothetical protein